MWKTLYLVDQKGGFWVGVLGTIEGIDELTEGSLQRFQSACRAVERKSGPEVNIFTKNGARGENYYVILSFY